MTHDHVRLLDAGAWLLAGVSLVSLANLALFATALAGFGSFILVLIRVYDRVKYGPARGRE